MSEDFAGTETLQLGADFAAVRTEEWESAILKDLKGADYEKKLIWRTEEGIPVRPYYRRQDAERIGELADLAPGEYPYIRGTGQGWEEAQTWVPPAGAIRADYLHEAGATAVQELGFALAEAVEKLQSAIETGKTVDTAAARTVFVYAVGSTYFVEIAKLRAARELWSAAVTAFKPEDLTCAIARIHVRTARLNKSLLDPYTNLLRVTTEAFSAIAGGCDSLTVEAFGFDPHLALNVQRILRDEAQLGRVADPAGGSYYIEALTDALAQESWRLFQQVEAAGGWTTALESGFVEAELTKSRQAKVNALASGRQTMVGVNNYPNTNDKTPDEPPPSVLAGDPFPQIRLAEPFEKIRERTLNHAEDKLGISPIPEDRP